MASVYFGWILRSVKLFGLVLRRGRLQEPGVPAPLGADLLEAFAGSPHAPGHARVSFYQNEH